MNEQINKLLILNTILISIVISALTLTDSMRVEKWHDFHAVSLNLPKRRSHCPTWCQPELNLDPRVDSLMMSINSLFLSKQVPMIDLLVFN